jgi:hypothetical protein
MCAQMERTILSTRPQTILAALAMGLLLLGAYVPSGGNVSLVSTSAMGYATGSGGTVTQLTNKSTAVTLNKLCGSVTMASGALAAAAEASFVVNNSTVAATDTIIVNHASGGTAGAYLVCCTAVGAGSFRVTISNVSTGSLTEVPVIRFMVLKAVNT